MDSIQPPPEINEHEKSDYPSKPVTGNPNQPERPIRIMIGILIVLFLLIVLGSFAFNRPAEQIAFVMVNALALFSLGVVIVNAYYANKTREIMAAQEFEATKQRRAMEATVKLTESIVKEMQAQRESANTQIAQAESQLRIARDQTIQMISQAEIMTQSLEQTRELFHLTERPILVIDSVKATIEPGRSIDPVIVKLMNRGKSPATNIVVWINVCRPPSRVTFDTHGATVIEPTLLAAGDSHEIIVHNEHEQSSIPLKQDAYDAVVADSKYIYVFGGGVYEDLSGNRHVMEKWAFLWIKEYGFVSEPGAIRLFEVMNNAIQKYADKKKNNQNPN